MSNWTHIVGCLYVKTCEQEKDIKKYVESKLKSAPKITGSEKNADIFVNALSGYNLSTWDDDDNKITYQTCVAITIIGDLRDTFIEQTISETRAFLNFVDEEFDISYSSISIYDSLLGKVDFIYEE